MSKGACKVLSVCLSARPFLAALPTVPKRDLETKGRDPLPVTSTALLTPLFAARPRPSDGSTEEAEELRKATRGG